MSTPRRAPSGAAVLRPELTEAVVDAVLAELAEVGHGRLSMQRVAARAGVGKSALYRRWPGKDEMVMDVVGRFGVPAEPPPDTGTLVGDLHALVVGMRDWLDHPRLASIVPDLLAESRRSPRLAEAFRERLSGPRRDRAREVLARAVARGEITPEQAGGVEAELVVDLLGSVPFWRVAVHGGPIDDEGAAALARLVARGMTAPH